MAGAAALGFADMRWIEPRWLVCAEHELRLGSQPAAPICLLQLSDFHASECVSLEFIQRAVERGLFPKRHFP